MPFQPGQTDNAAMDFDVRQPRIVVDGSMENLAVLRRFVRERFRLLGFDEANLSGVLTSVDEAATNIVVHGYAENGIQGPITMRVERKQGALVIQLTDKAPHFDPTRLEYPDVNKPLEQRSPGGLGVFLMREFMDEVRYRALPAGNELTLVKRTE